MITRHEIKNKNNEEILYLYMNYNYEFAQELGNPSKKMTLLSEIKNYIDKMKIQFKGKYIVLVIAGLASITLACQSAKLEESQNTFTTTPESVEIIMQENYPNISPIVEEKSHDEAKSKEEVKEESTKVETHPSISTSNPSKPTTPPTEKPNTSKPDTPTKPVEKVEEVTPVTPPVTQGTVVTIYRSTGIVETMELETYLIGVVAAEMPASFHIEALKAQAIVARTYALNKIQEGKVLTDTVSTQAYKDNNQLKKTWGTDFQKYYDKIKNAVDATKGMVVTYQGNYIDAVFHSTSNGYTVDAKDIWGKDVPYLKSVASPFDLFASSYLRETTKQIEDIEKKLGIIISPASPIEIIKKDQNGRVLQVQIGQNTYTGIELRNKLGLRSTDFEITVEDNQLTFKTKGFGHGVGMSQYGAQGMANNGYNYQQIIKHYYNGVEIIKK